MGGGRTNDVDLVVWACWLVDVFFRLIVQVFEFDRRVQGGIFDESDWAAVTIASHWTSLVFDPLLACSLERGAIGSKVWADRESRLHDIEQTEAGMVLEVFANAGKVVDDFET